MSTSGVCDINRVVFAGQDFQTFRQENLDFLEENHPDVFNDAVDNDIGIALIESNAFSSQSIAFYVNRRVTDLYLPTAVSPTNVSKLARFLGYKPAGASSSVAALTVELTDGPYAFPVLINQGFKFDGPNQTVWEYRGEVPVTYDAGETVQTVEVSEGESSTAVFVSDGSGNQIFSLTAVADGKFLAEGSVQVVINNEEWEEVAVVPFMEVKQYEVASTQDPPTIRFGDGVQGAIPPEGAEIAVSFFITTGLQGRVGSDQVTKARDILVASGNRIDLTITQPSPSVGGEDPEDIRITKVNAPRFFRSQDVAVVKTDYDTIANLFSGVARADAQIVRGIDDELVLNGFLDDIVDTVSGCPSGVENDVTTIVTDLRNHLSLTISDTCKSNTVMVQVLSEDVNHKYVAPSDTLLTDLQAHLQERADAVHTVVCTSGVGKIVTASVRVRAKINQFAVEQVVLNKIRDALVGSTEEPFGLLVGREFGDSLFLWSIRNAIDDAVEEREIEYVNVRITAPVSLLDADGNLIIDKLQVIQGDITTLDLDAI